MHLYVNMTLIFSFEQTCYLKLSLNLSGSIDRSFSRESKLSVVHHNGKKRARKSQLSKNTGKKPSPSKRRKTESSSRVQKSLNAKGSRRSVSHDEISDSQSEPLENEADPTQKKSLDISG